MIKGLDIINALVPDETPTVSDPTFNEQFGVIECFGFQSLVLDWQTGEWVHTQSEEVLA